LAPDQQELELLQNLYHANLVQFIDYKDSPEYLYFILEYFSPLSVPRVRDPCGV
jgi:hypothetical protein